MLADAQRLLERAVLALERIAEALETFKVDEERVDQAIARDAYESFAAARAAIASVPRRKGEGER